MKTRYVLRRVDTGYAHCWRSSLVEIEADMVREKLPPHEYYIVTEVHNGGNWQEVCAQWQGMKTDPDAPASEMTKRERMVLDLLCAFRIAENYGRLAPEAATEAAMTDANALIAALNATGGGDEEN